MVNHTNIDKLKIFTWFKYLFNCGLIAIRINYVDLLSSDCQQNDDIHFVVVNPKNMALFKPVKMNHSSKATATHLPMFLKWLLFNSMINIALLYYLSFRITDKINNRVVF